MGTVCSPPQTVPSGDIDNHMTTLRLNALLSLNDDYGLNITNTTNDDSSAVYLTSGDKVFIISLSICICLFFVAIFISCFTGPTRWYFPSYDKSVFGLSWRYGPAELWSPFMYAYTIRGGEYFLMYFWVIKDVLWTQDCYYPAQVFGSCAVFIAAMLAVRSAIIGHYREVFVNTATALWLMGNFWWMEGELIDYQYPDAPNYPVYPTYSIQSNNILVSAACLLAVYYLIIRPLDLLKPSQEISDFYNENNMESPFPLIFPLWRDYENFHIVVWLGKDIAWNGAACNNNVNWDAMWNVFVIPTILIGIHFMVLTFSMKFLFIDHVHYIGQFLWVSGNILWAFGDMYKPLGEYDDAVPLSNISDDSYNYLRWWGAWVFLSALSVLAALYVYWVPATYLGWIEEDATNVRRKSTIRDQVYGWNEPLIASAERSDESHDVSDQLLRQ